MKRKTQNALALIGVLVLASTAVGGCVAMEVKLWNECRASNSWFYCLRVLS